MKLFRKKKHRVTSCENTIPKIASQYQQIMDSIPDVFYLCHANGNIIDANKKAIHYTGYQKRELKTMNLQDIDSCFESYQQLQQENTSLIPKENLLLTGKHTRKDRSNFPSEVHISCYSEGDTRCIVAFVRDMTDRTRQQDILGARLRLIEYAANHSVKKLLQKFLDESELLTGSKVGFYHFLDADQETLSLQAWSTNTLKHMCQTKGEGLHYSVSKAGVWVDCIHQRKTVVHNDYAKLVHKKGLPKGHAPVLREMVVPVIRNKKIVAILGLGNKDTHYTHQDVEVVEDLAELAWEIIERNKAEEKVRNLSEVVQQSPEGVAITNKDGRIEYINPKFSELSGYSLIEAKGRIAHIFNPQNNPQDASFYEKVWKTISSGQIWQGEFYNKRKNGDKYWEHVKVTPLKDTSGIISNYVILAEDITEKKKILLDLRKAKDQAEENEIKLKEAQRIAKTGNWELNLRNDKLYWSEQVYRIFDCKPTEFQSTFEAFLQLVHPDDRNRVKRAYDKHLSSGEAFNINHRILLPNNQVKYVNEKCETEYNSRRQAIRSVGTISDITETILTQLELEQAKEKAEESDRLKTAFLNNMSHEIRTPMNGIIGFANILAKNEISETDRKEYCNIVTRSSNQLLSIVNDILDIAKIEAGQVNISEERVDLSQLCHDVMSMHQIVAANKNIQLLQCQEPECKIGHVVADKAKVTQILNNLLNNAIKFTTKGSVQLKCQVKNGFIEFSVIDSGIGIQKKLHSEVFDRFRQAETSVTRNYGGAGLGLSICKGLVEQMGGRIGLKSSFGKGSTFYFTIPYKPVGIQNDITQAKPNPGIDYSAHTVLVVEDEEINYLYVNRILANKNIKHLHARNGKEAIDIFNKNKSISAVLMDIKMPVMNGYDATREIKKINHKVPIIAISAHAFTEDKDKAFQAGCDDYLAKPVDEEPLLATIQKHLFKDNTLTPAV